MISWTRTFVPMASCNNLLYWYLGDGIHFFDYQFIKLDQLLFYNYLIFGLVCAFKYQCPNGCSSPHTHTPPHKHMYTHPHTLTHMHTQVFSQTSNQRSPQQQLLRVHDIIGMLISDNDCVVVPRIAHPLYVRSPRITDNSRFLEEMMES